ncbi:MAG TPA: hypothetical protein DHN29_14145 [Cytophagales bacterium]|nr:hypothetical protein [Cytophagales bacterium]|tara:strand:+ start:759 stop:971 length:213 start_codon:yes stop_codon:yes gene_type:complete
MPENLFVVMHNGKVISPSGAFKQTHRSVWSKTLAKKWRDAYAHDNGLKVGKLNNGPYVTFGPNHYKSGEK